MIQNIYKSIVAAANYSGNMANATSRAHYCEKSEARHPYKNSNQHITARNCHFSTLGDYQ